MIELYYWPTPNGHKASIALEEMSFAYEVHPVNILKSEQFKETFLALNPNHKIPTLVDRSGPEKQPITLFESGAILEYLAEKSGRFLPTKAHARWNVKTWLYFQVASMGPMLGQCGHFLGYAPEDVPYAKVRYHTETKRLYGVLEGQLKSREFICDEYSIADMATYPWIAPVIRDLHHMNIDDYPNLKRWARTVESRPAVQRGMAVLGDVMKIGNPDDDARKSLFGSQQ
ncbi:thiol:disulfide oxidoreductase [Iodidimonas gelatinilytica]|uniref:Thiol:disulfide oxidoreductase n=1 Tax=Iodidimonas gelatinilytica TaxID=1236966 RepID=A0A5A7MRB8_9PROT|nr:glutathione S-transferase N-terminal domain-containing protein [Iodidimonas gelatinilytica]GEQ98491.1 thiol:disulfide oxidoreductase [Iodidimonas gelatinilytica]